RRAIELSERWTGQVVIRTMERPHDSLTRRRAVIRMIRHVERLCAKLQRLLLLDGERARQAHVESDAARSFNVSRSGISVSPGRRQCECRGIQPAVRTSVRKIRIGQNLIRALIDSGVADRR